MPNYRIPNQTYAALPANANWWKGDADGVWTINDLQRARAGGEWPPPFEAPPTYADGYTWRTSNYVFAPYWNYGGMTNNIGSANQGGSSAAASTVGNFNALQMRCITHDWTLQGIQHGYGTGSATGGILYYRIGVWEGGTVNDETTGSGLMQDSGNSQMTLQSNTGAAASVIIPAGASNTDGTAVLTQNTWYTVAIVYTQATTLYRFGYDYSSGYSATGLGTFTVTNANNGGSISLYPSMEYANISGRSNSPSNGWPTLSSGSYSTYTTADPMSMIKARWYV